MRRVLIGGLLVSSALNVVLAIAIATIGTQLDDSRISRQDLGGELSVLRSMLAQSQRAHAGASAQLETCTADAAALKARAHEQLRTIEILKVESEHLRRQLRASQTTRSSLDGRALSASGP